MSMSFMRLQTKIDKNTAELFKEYQKRTKLSNAECVRKIIKNHFWVEMVGL